MIDKKDNLSSQGYTLVNFCEFDKYATTSYCAIHDIDESLNLGDITKVDETNLKPFNMICGGSPCFIKGTMILTVNGYKDIAEVSVGDIVYTKEGRLKQVVRIGSDGEKEVYKLSAMGILPLTCTENHPFWVRERIKKWNNTIRRYDYVFSKPQKKELRQLSFNDNIKDYIGVPIISDITNDLYDIDGETLWLLGRYVADGHLTKSKVIISVGETKINDFDNITMFHRTYPHTKSCYRIVFNKSSELYKIIDTYDFGTCAINKNIPMNILQLPKDKLSIFLDGYMSGDGCVICENKISQAATISRSLAESLVLVVQKVFKIGCKIYYDIRPNKYIIEGREVNQHNTYLIRFLNHSSKKTYYVDDNYIWYPIKNVEKLVGKERIYNIEVVDDHTYIANNATVFNCQDFSVAGKQAGSKWKCKDCDTEYNPLTVHFSKRHKCPNCDSENLDKTRSSLLVEWLRIIRANKPKWGIYENVKNIVGKQFKDTFQMFINELHEYGYNTYYQVLNN